MNDELNKQEKSAVGRTREIEEQRREQERREEQRRQEEQERRRDAGS